MARMSATDAAVQVMLDEGIEFVFGVPGAAILPLYQSILKSGRIRHYMVRHEEGGTHAADGYSRATGKVGVMLGTSGPAGTNIPFVLVMINNGYLGLIRQAELSYEMNFAVDIAYTGDNDDGELSHMELGINHVKAMEAMGGLGRRIERPEDIRAALAWATRESEARRLPVLVEIMVEREANAAMGTALNAIKEFEPLPEQRIPANTSTAGSSVLNTTSSSVAVK